VGDHYRSVAGFCDHHRVRVDLARSEESAGALAATLFFIGNSSDHKAAAELLPGCRQILRRHDKSCKGTFHVEAPSTVDLTVYQLATPRIPAPAAGGWDHVDVAAEDECRSRRSIAPRREQAHEPFLRLEQLNLEPRRLEDLGEHAADRPRLTGWIRARDSNESLSEVDDRLAPQVILVCDARAAAHSI
jgi:hypothetical protein